MAHSDKYLAPGVDYEFSASQITSWMRCRRLFGWTYLMGLRGVATDSQALGTRVHGMIEQFLLRGTALDFTTEEGEIIGAGLEHIPEPTADMIVEGKKMGDPTEERVKFKHRGRHLWIGYKDLTRGNEVWDWKTTKDIAKWAKTPEDLLTDPQAVLYTVENGAPVVRLQWTYFQTPKKKHKSLPVVQEMTREHALRGFEILESCADDAMIVVRGAQGLDGEALRGYILSLPHNANECEAFGGCPHRGLCNLSPQERFKAKMKQANSQGEAHMSLFERLSQQNKQEAAAAPTGPAINPPEEKVADDVAAKNAAIVAQHAAEVAARVKAAQDAEKAEKKAAKAAAKAPTSVPATPPAGLTLYLDCFPICKPPIETHLFEDLAAKARARIFETLQLQDFRFAEYGQGPGIFQQTIAQLLDEGVLKVTNLVVDTRVPEALACLALLKSRATLIVQSTK